MSTWAAAADSHQLPTIDGMPPAFDRRPRRQRQSRDPVARYLGDLQAAVMEIFWRRDSATVREAAHVGVSMMTVHASGGTKMLRAAAEAARSSNSPPKILAVTVLTSMDENDLHEIGVSGQPVDQVLKLAGIALAAGCDGIVSSAREVRNLRTSFGQSFLAITPGVRPAGAAHGDQARVVTPAEAIAAGATHIVMGRPITAALRPEAAIQSVLRELEGAETVAGSKAT